MATLKTSGGPRRHGHRKPGVVDHREHNRLAAELRRNVVACTSRLVRRRDDVGNISIDGAAIARAGVAIPLAMFVYLVVCTPIAGGITMGPVRLWEPLTKNLLYAGIATLVVAPLVLGGGGWFERLLSRRPMAWLGAISYEIFLLHVLVMALVLGVSWVGRCSPVRCRCLYRVDAGHNDSAGVGAASAHMAFDGCGVVRQIGRRQSFLDPATGTGRVGCRLQRL